MLRKTPTRLIVAVLLVLCHDSPFVRAQLRERSDQGQGGVLEKMITANGVVVLHVDLAGLNYGTRIEKAKTATLRFTLAPDSSFKVLIFNNLIRGPEPSSMALIPQNAVSLPEGLKALGNQLVIEKAASDQAFDLAVRDGKTGFVFFTIEGHHYDYDADKHLLNINGGRLLISKEFATRLGQTAKSGRIVGDISIAATLYPIEIQNIVNGAVKSGVEPANGTTPGPDVIVGEIPAMAQAGQPHGGYNGNFVGIGIGTTSCNAGAQDVDWFPLPNNDHPVVSQNLYRMSGGPNGTDRFEQIGQSWAKHTYTTLTENVCGYGCNGVGGSYLGSGCSDPYTASLNYEQNLLGSRAWVNPFTGYFPGSDPDPDDHVDHQHTGTGHRVTVSMDDLIPEVNVGATYYAEGHYIVPYEYAWCQAHPRQCNMYNNVSYRQFTVTSSSNPFTFAAAGPTVRTQPAIQAWTGATINQFEPVPGADGIGFVGYKVTNPSDGVWHYEYAVYNENINRAIQSFSVPLGCAINVSNPGFHAPPQEPGWTYDGTFNNAGFSSAPWDVNQTGTALTWSSETLAQNQNANAIRWGTLYNFRFDSNKPPQAAQAMIGFFKSGSPIMVSIQAPTPDSCGPLSITNVVSRKTHGAAGDFDINLPISGEPGVECRSGGGAGNHTIVFSFTNNVVTGTASVTAGMGTVSGGPAFFGNTMTVNVTNVMDDQQITVTASGVKDTFGQTLPDTAVSANILMGDTTGNKSVNSSDVLQTKQQVGMPVDSSNFREDINSSGTISASDVTQVKLQVGNSLP